MRAATATARGVMKASLLRPGASLDAIVFATHSATVTHPYRVRMTSV